MVAKLEPPSGRPGVTFTEIADQYGKSARYVAENPRWGQHPDWPGPVGKRGRSQEFNAVEVEAFVRDHHERQQSEFVETRLYTVAEIADLSGMTAATIRGDISRGRWPEPDQGDGVKLWLGATVRAHLGKRRVYRKAPHTCET